MNATTVAVDLAKNVFELAVADQHWKIDRRHRLTRGQFGRWFATDAVGLVVMEAPRIRRTMGLRRLARLGMKSCCCRRATYGPTSSVRPMRSMPPHCSRHFAAPTLPRCASSRLSSRRDHHTGERERINRGCRRQQARQLRCDDQQ